MTARQLEICQLLRDLAKTPELIAIQAELPIEYVRKWLRLGAGMACQLSLFDTTAPAPEPTIKPVATNERSHGLHLFSR